jgi:CBS domain-containing protein
MVETVLTVRPHDSVEHVKGLLATRGIGAVPVAGPEGEVVGIVSARDLLEANGSSPVSSVMTNPVITVTAYSEISQAARAMRSSRIHHLVVTHEKRIVGILSSFDLLKLVEERRYEPKARPTRPGRPRTIQDRRQGRK